MSTFLTKLAERAFVAYCRREDDKGTLSPELRPACTSVAAGLARDGARDVAGETAAKMKALDQTIWEKSQKLQRLNGGRN
ncbi:MAG TPA: hypothetical protein VLJ37_11510 [bacterium]|nr:hypothetical protein [bacterium]